MLSRSETAAAWEGVLGQDRRGEAPDVVAFGDRLAAHDDRFPADPLPLAVLPVPRRSASSSVRSIHVLDPSDHARYLAVVSRLAPCIEPGLSASVVADRAVDWSRGLTIEPWRRAHRRYRTLVRRLLRKRRGAVLVADVRECFERIRPDVVVEVLGRMGCAPQDVRHLEVLLARFAAAGVRGLPVGPSPSAVLANAVLSIGDDAIAAEGARHVRWVDDFLVAADGEGDAARLREALRVSLAGWGLDLAEEKCRTVEIDGGSLDMIAVISDAWLAPEKAFFPVAISYSTAPRAKMSVRPSASLPSSCSGAMYWNVPRIVPACVRFVPACVWRIETEEELPAGETAASFARPKSTSLTPDFVSMMLPGLRSR